jgi:hypothetical protein
MHIDISEDDLAVVGCLFVFSILGWLFWEAVAWVCKHIHIAWV